MVFLPLKHRTSCHLLWCLYKLIVKRKVHFYFSIILTKYRIMKQPERRKIIGENIFPWEVKNHAYSSPLHLLLLPEPPKCLHYIPGLWINVGKWLLFPEGHGWAKIRVLSWVRGVMYRWSPTLVWCEHFLQPCSGCLLKARCSNQRPELVGRQGVPRSPDGGVSALQRLGVNIQEGFRSMVSALLSLLSTLHGWLAPNAHPGCVSFHILEY